MSLPVVTVVIPTIDGREDHYRRCITAYNACATGSYELELLTVRNAPTCGWGWQRGAEKMSPASGYLHFTCDDIEPQPGWADAGIAALKNKVLPAPRTLNGYTGAPEYHPCWGGEAADGEPVYMTSLPFMTRALWEQHVAPMFTGHYFTDDWVSFRSLSAGYRIEVRRGFFFKHYWAQVGRGAGFSEAGRMNCDQVLYDQAKRLVQQGQWTEPWPPPEVVRPNG